MMPADDSWRSPRPTHQPVVAAGRGHPGLHCGGAVAPDESGRGRLPLDRLVLEDLDAEGVELQLDAARLGPDDLPGESGGPAVHLRQELPEALRN